MTHYPTYPVTLSEMLSILKDIGFTKLENSGNIYDIDTFSSQYETDNEFWFNIEEKTINEYNTALEYTGTYFYCLK